MLKSDLLVFFSFKNDFGIKKTIVATGEDILKPSDDCDDCDGLQSRRIQSDAVTPTRVDASRVRQGLCRRGASDDLQVPVRG